MASSSNITGIKASSSMQIKKKIEILHVCWFFFQNFTNSFQMAREALSAATAQAAEKAASSVRDFAQKSFRLSMDINLKAPLIIVPQSSFSQNALVMDLGLIKVGNSFSLLPIDGSPLPAIIDNLDIQLSQLKLSRLVFPVSRKWCQIHHVSTWNLILSLLYLNILSSEPLLTRYQARQLNYWNQ